MTTNHPNKDGALESIMYKVQALSTKAQGQIYCKSTNGAEPTSSQNTQVSQPLTSHPAQAGILD